MRLAFEDRLTRLSHNPAEQAELALFIDDRQNIFLQDSMWDRGYLDNTQMAGAFQWLNSNDLVWSRMLKDYLVGERTPASDLLADVELTVLLTSGGHNVGIVNPPGAPRRSYQVLTPAHDSNHVDPDTWLKTAPQHEGSCWPDWAAWLQARSGQPVAAPAMGAAAGLKPISPAPGTYVMQK